MDYQLVLQFRGDSFTDLEHVIALENDLIKTLGQSANVDGHDIGSGEANIFIITSEPKKIFGSVKQVLQRTGKLKELVAAFRELKGEKYTIIWPEEFSGHFSVA